MKIEIEFDSSHDAKITIDGRQFSYGYRSAGFWGWLEPDVFGKEPNDLDETIGGMVAQRIKDPLVDILQAWLPDTESPSGECWKTWEKLSEEVADEVYEKMNL